MEEIDGDDEDELQTTRKRQRFGLWAMSNISFPSKAQR